VKVARFGALTEVLKDSVLPRRDAVGIDREPEVLEELDASTFKIYVVQEPSFQNVGNHSPIDAAYNLQYKLPAKL
jgi:hypothetical protein